MLCSHCLFTKTMQTALFQNCVYMEQSIYCILHSGGGGGGSFHHPQEAFLAQFILYVHNGRLIPHSLHFIFSRQRHAESDVIEHLSSRYIMSLFYYKHHFVLNRYVHFSQNYGHVINDCRENLRFHLNLQFNYFLKIRD